VLSGGELGAAMMVDVVARLLPGVLGNEDSAVQESFTEEGLLDCPQYTRRRSFGMGGAGGAAGWQSRGDSEMAAGSGAGEDGADAAGPGEMRK